MTTPHAPNWSETVQAYAGAPGGADAFGSYRLVAISCAACTCRSVAALRPQTVPSCPRCNQPAQVAQP